ncbi:MAG: ribonuclease III [bacterium]
MLPELEKTIGIQFNNKEIIKEALTHRSILSEKKNVKHNERLEFLGDAVLEIVVTEYLYNEYPDYDEGLLTSFRAAAVKTESLSETAVELNLGQFLIMSSSEESTGGKSRPYILANCVEAIIGAIYIDLGFAKAKEFIDKYINSKLKNIVDNRLDIDPKSKFQEYIQETFKQTPYYKVVSEEGPDHDKVFEVIAMVGETAYSVGKGKSKQSAEQEAARLSFEKVSIDEKKTKS